MRILLDYRPALRARTGVGQYVHELARALAASAPADETLILFSSSWKDRLSADEVPGAQIVDRRVPVRLLNAIWHRAGWPPAEALAGRADVVHSMHPLLMPARQAAQLVTIHDLDFLDHPERTRAEIRRDYPALARDHARRADHIVVNSQHTADTVVARFGIDPAKISICFPGAPSWAVREIEPSPGCLLFLGTLEPRKNLSTLLDAYEALVARRPDTIPLVLAGRATPEAADIVARVARPPLAGRVQLTGYVTDQERIEWYGRARALVLPSHMEGFGMTAVEAMASGVPVIAANRGALVESVGAAGRLIDPDDASAWSRAIEEILSSEATRRQMRDAGLAQARRFHWRETAAGVRRAWTLAIEHRKARRG